MRDDPFIDFLFKVKEFYKKNPNAIFGGALIIVCALLFFFIYSAKHGTSFTKADEAVGNAWSAYNSRNLDKAVQEFQGIVKEYPSTPQGAESAQMLGSIFLGQEKFDEAIKWFTIASSGKGDLASLTGLSLEGLASCYEAKGDPKRAIENLEKALGEDQLKYRHPAIRWKMALLNQKISQPVRAQTLCKEILSDTTAREYQQRAENLLAALSASNG
jgi:tetratricopeptide (TPR) repeat protein